MQLLCSGCIEFAVVGHCLFIQLPFFIIELKKKKTGVNQIVGVCN